jgi:riboflavin kinase/FMN adenylyltransferase
MRILRNAFEAGREFPGSVLCLGKFDAMHRGHLRLLEAARKESRRHGRPLMAATFDPAPAEHARLYGYRPVLPLAERLRLMGRLGVDAVALLPFDKPLACLTPEAFATTVLAAQLKPAFVCVGEDFCFGKDRAGRAGTLGELGPALGFIVVVVPLLRVDGEKVTAERIRRSLESGDRACAERMLGRPL